MHNLVLNLKNRFIKNDFNIRLMSLDNILCVIIRSIYWWLHFPFFVIYICFLCSVFKFGISSVGKKYQIHLFYFQVYLSNLLCVYVCIIKGQMGFEWQFVNVLFTETAGSIIKMFTIMICMCTSIWKGSYNL